MNHEFLEWQLTFWRKGQAASERMSAVVLQADGYTNVAGRLPTGGSDGQADIDCHKGSVYFIAACYFPTEPKKFSEILKKFNGDMAGAKTNGASGFCFITGQKLTPSERLKLENIAIAGGLSFDLYHLERLLPHATSNSSVQTFLLDVLPDMSEANRLKRDADARTIAKVLEWMDFDNIGYIISRAPKAFDPRFLTMHDCIEATFGSPAFFISDPTLDQLFGDWFRKWCDILTKGRSVYVYQAPWLIFPTPGDVFQSQSEEMLFRELESDFGTYHALTFALYKYLREFYPQINLDETSASARRNMAGS